MKTLKKALSYAFVLGWAGAALSADAPASGQGSGSLPPTTPPAQGAPAGACCDTGCGNGWLGCFSRDNCGDDCVPGSGVSFGATWHILRPVINDNAALTVTSFGVTTTATVSKNFQYGFKSDPSLWAGYRSCDGLGFSVTWFHMDNSSQTETATQTSTNNVAPPAGLPFPVVFIVLPPGANVPITATNDIKMDIWDFDVTQRVEVCHFDLTFGAGIRYMWIAQDYNFATSIPAFSYVHPAITIASGARNSFNGGGPTLILDGVRRFGCSGFGLYANSRAGVLFGPKHEAAATIVSGGGPPAIATANSDNESTIGLGEIELGVQWGRSMGSVSPFVRLGFEGREYWGIGNASNVFSGNNSTPVGAYGVALSAGVGW
jgi:hypothetical protein